MPWAWVVADRGVLLRRPTPDDVPGVFAVHSDPAVYEYDPAEIHPDPGYSAHFLEPITAQWQERGFGYWAVLVPRVMWPAGEPGAGDRDGNRVFAGLGGIRHHTLGGERVLNVYYRFATAVQGRGLARTVLEEALALAPLVASGADLVVRTRPANLVARHVAERAGFVDEGLEPGTADMQLLRYHARGPTGTVRSGMMGP